MKKLLYLVAVLCLSLASVSAVAQDRSTTGSIGGVVQDADGPCPRLQKIVVNPKK